MFGAAVAALLLIVSPAQGAPNNIVGLNTHQPADDVLDAAKSLGVTWVRIDFNWYQAETKQGKYSWALFDKIINNAISRGLKVFPTIGYGPAWAKDPAHKNADGKTHNDTPKAGTYQAFCKAAAARYKGKITHWGLWNEPNLDFFESSDKNLWINRIVIEGIKGIKAGCPSCKVLGPELASVGKVHAAWFDASLKALKKAGLMYDIITWHNYAAFHEIKPNLIPQCPTGDYFLHDVEKGRRCFGVLIGSKAPWEVMQDNKVTHLPFWLTETGYKAPLSDTKKTGEQQTYYRRVLEEQLKRTWFQATFFYEIIDDNNIADKWGMAVRSSGSGQKWPGSYKLKPVWSYIKKWITQKPKPDMGVPKPDVGAPPKLDKGTTPKQDKGTPPKLDGKAPPRDTKPWPGKEKGVKPKKDSKGPGPVKDTGGGGEPVGGGTSSACGISGAGPLFGPAWFGLTLLLLGYRSLRRRR